MSQEIKALPASFTIEDPLLIPDSVVDAITQDIAPLAHLPLKERRVAVFSMYKFIQAACEIQSLLAQSAHYGYDQQQSEVGNYLDLSRSVRDNHKIKAIITFVSALTAGVAKAGLSGYINAPDHTVKFVMAQTATVFLDAFHRAAPSYFDAKAVLPESQRSLTNHEIQVLTQKVQRDQRHMDDILSTAQRIIQLNGAIGSVRA